MAQRHGDVETNDTTAATDAGHRETAITTARPSTTTDETGGTSATKKTHEKHPFLTRKGDDGFNPTREQASKGVTGFRQPHAWFAGTRCDTSRYLYAHPSENSHAIRVSEVSTKSENVAIPPI